jgi:cell division transport system ATP-binding protein
MEKIIEFKDVSKTYDSETHALNNVSIEIEKGEFVFIVGASGAGKSTFLKLIMHESTPSGGTIIVNGMDVTKLKRRQVPYLRRNMGMVFQDFRLIDKMTVYDNVAFAMRAIGAPPAEIKERVPHILSLVGLSHKLKNRPSELSGGEQQRVSLARALVNNPAIIIADEPTGNIDPEMSYEIIELLSEINEREGTTILVVTHEHELVKQFSKRVIEIEKGRVVNDTKEPVSSLDEIELTVETDASEESEKTAPGEVTEEASAETEKTSEEAEETEKETETVEEETAGKAEEQPEEAEEVEETEESVESESSDEAGEVEENVETEEAVEEEADELETSEDMTAEDILNSLSVNKNAEIDDASVDEVLAELRSNTESKGGED